MKSLLTGIFVLCLSMSGTTLHSQVGGGSEQPFTLGLGGASKGERATSLPKELAPVTRTIDPEFYICGPGDILALIGVMPVNLDLTLLVSAEGTVLLPRVGMVPVAGKTLARAKQDIMRALEGKYPRFEGSVGLVQPRPVIVTVTGAVKSPGPVTLSAGSPVSLAVHLANIDTEERPKDLTLIPRLPSEPEVSFYTRLSRRYFGLETPSRHSQRRIHVRHLDGTTERADLPLFMGTRDPRYDPLLREGDMIVVPNRAPGSPFISAHGAVRNPGVFEFLPEDRLSDLVHMAFGVDPLTDLSSSELVRADGRRIPVSFDAQGRLSSVDVPLAAGDQLIVQVKRSPVLMGSIAVDGEVLRPGVYPVTPGITHIRDVIRMAGGFTDAAWPALSELYRREVDIDGNPVDREREKDRNFHKSKLYLEDTLHWQIDNRIREGRVAVDFHRLFTSRDTTADCALEDGDILIVPRNTGTIYIYGQVNNAGHIPWKSGKGFAWYIEQAGGFAEGATKSRARVIKANSRAWMDPDDTEIEPGDRIYVPHEPLVKLTTISEVLGVVATIVGGLAGITSLIITLQRP